MIHSVLLLYFGWQRGSYGEAFAFYNVENEGEVKRNLCITEPADTQENNTLFANSGGLFKGSWIQI